SAGPSTERGPADARPVDVTASAERDGGRQRHPHYDHGRRKELRREQPDHGGRDQVEAEADDPLGSGAERDDPGDDQVLRETDVQVRGNEARYFADACAATAAAFAAIASASPR
ncbi:MAG TPA: hypothetical protein PLV93_02810, partial [Microthrixaceae bacterium]|nr:hypothetical protein [Microthrixaceae bacterium]